jgi:four helix bundle protein
MSKRFEDLEIWEQSRTFCKNIYKITNYELFNKDFRFRDQIRASSSSAMDSIAERFERNDNKEFIQFLYIAKGSCGETRSQLYRVLDNNYINTEEFETFFNKVLGISKSISQFIQYLKQSEITGHKNIKSLNYYFV